MQEKKRQQGLEEKEARERERRELHLTLAGLEGSAEKARNDLGEAEARMAEMALKTEECVRQKESAEEGLGMSAGHGTASETGTAQDQRGGDGDGDEKKAFV